jgi:hypothetical protein
VTVLGMLLGRLVLARLWPQRLYQQEQFGAESRPIGLDRLTKS